MNESMEKVLNSIAEDILSLAHLILDENGLKNSALKEDVRCTVEASGNPVFTILFNDYIDYIEGGRKSDSGIAPPISELRDWAQRKGIPATNDVLYAIAETIRKQGMAPRPILAMLEQEIDKSFENEWADQLFDAIIKEIEVFFND
ncbi:hypothetical protein CLV62_101478 [Dysgonomonas alginatilytica]|uniref:Uncharacterized protein n=1 Tax=Dysgonomonas alginatilytica TaxID=1605892 RepID=A0A2V3PUB3_9BACT|nr:hypothetical protein [Dysgonomonas alginatilytica]PXV69209.1 hypothetical protein CLV62_101478 [Dysgonomonas alginatilytica]